MPNDGYRLVLIEKWKEGIIHPLNCQAWMEQVLFKSYVVQLCIENKASSSNSVLFFPVDLKKFLDRKGVRFLTLNLVWDFQNFQIKIWSYTGLSGGEGEGREAQTKTPFGKIWLFSGTTHKTSWNTKQGGKGGSQTRIPSLFSNKSRIFFWSFHESRISYSSLKKMSFNWLVNSCQFTFQ